MVFTFIKQGLLWRWRAFGSTLPPALGFRGGSGEHGRGELLIKSKKMLDPLAIARKRLLAVARSTAGDASCNNAASHQTRVTPAAKSAACREKLCARQIFLAGKPLLRLVRLGCRANGQFFAELGDATLEIGSRPALPFCAGLRTAKKLYIIAREVLQGTKMGRIKFGVGSPAIF